MADVSFVRLIEPLLSGRRLAESEAAELMAFLMDGEATPAQIGAFLALVSLNGVTGGELAGFAQALRDRAETLKHDAIGVVDTCGTGGGSPSFNLSTGAAIVAAAAGAKVAKHGNRGVTSKCGSADVLEALGVAIGGDSEVLRRQLEENGIVFLFAPSHHPAMRHVGPARRELGFRTVFNALGPLANPAGCRRQVIGVFQPYLLEPVAEALCRLGTERAIVAHGADGLDEVSPSGPTQVVRVEDGRRWAEVLEPATFGLDPVAAEHLAPGASAEENALILREALSDPQSPRSRALLPGAACALVMAGLAESFRVGADMARQAVADGKAIQKLEAMASTVQA